MKILYRLRHRFRAYLSPRLWILGIVLLVLCALAVLQFRWIDQVAQAERERAKRNLTTAVSDFERDFDIEITRVVAAFEFLPLNPSEYADRYKEWLRLAPYPHVIRGIYILDTQKSGAALKEAIPGEPPIRSTEWKKDLPKLALPLHVTTASPRPISEMGFKVVARAGLVGSWELFSPSVLVDGNPAFLFPMLATPGVVTQTVTRTSSSIPPLLGSSLSMTGPGGPPSHWAVIVLDAAYLESALLPSLLKTHFPNSPSSDYDVLVVDKTRSGPQRILYQSPSALPEEKLSHADSVTSLFLHRLDCFAPSLSPGGAAVADAGVLQFGSRSNSPATYLTSMGAVSFAAEGQALPGKDRLSEILRRQPQSCTVAPVGVSANSVVQWELLVRYRVGSLDQAMAAFRRSNLLWSVGALSILAIGICMLVALTERARSLAQMQSEFVLGVSHELRTPLTVICVAADNLKKGMAQDVEQVHRYGDIISTHASELTNMIEETLVFARVQSGSLIGKRTLVNPDEIVKSALASCDSALQKAGIAVMVHLAPQLPLIEADVHLLVRCLENLIQNVIKYAAAGKWIAIRAERVVVSEGERVQLSVEDRGPGVSPPDLPHIFEPFYRGKCVQPTAVPGMGLGLTLVKRVVEAHLGRIEVNNSGHGSSFSMLLRPWQ